MSLRITGSVLKGIGPLFLALLALHSHEPHADLDSTNTTEPRGTGMGDPIEPLDPLLSFAITMTGPLLLGAMVWVATKWLDP